MTRQEIQTAAKRLPVLLLAGVMTTAQAQQIVTPQQTPFPENPDFETLEIETLHVQGNVYMLAGAGANIAVQIGHEGALVVGQQRVGAESDLQPRRAHALESREKRHGARVAAGDAVDDPLIDGLVVEEEGRDDPLGGMQVSGDGFAAMAATLRRLADEVCGGRLAYFLEGGYSFSGLRQGIDAVLDTSLAPEAPDLPPPVEAPRESLLDRLVGRVIAVHGERYRELGAS